MPRRVPDFQRSDWGAEAGAAYERITAGQVPDVAFFNTLLGGRYNGLDDDILRAIAEAAALAEAKIRDEVIRALVRGLHASLRVESLGWAASIPSHLGSAGMATDALASLVLELLSTRPKKAVQPLADATHGLVKEVFFRIDEEGELAPHTCAGTVRSSPAR